MAEKKTKTKAQKKKRKRTRPQKRQSRLTRAQAWLPTYEGTHIVRAYRKKFNVDTVCAVRELSEIGYKFKEGYVENLLKAEMTRREQLKQKKAEEKLSKQHLNNNEEQNDLFYYIAGYTSGGAPYGITWKEMGLNPYENENEDNNNNDYPKKANKENT
ncbi:MAG: hypothetical protein FWG55_00170 [Candidatus Bathyarchaeota archaeon]|nr:hypothetical protein [Candidatus Termiticorpusculum sp.]